MPELDLILIVGSGILIADACWQWLKRNAR